MGEFLQSRGHRKGSGIAEPQAAGLSHQYFYRPAVLPGNLFPANGTVRLADGDSGKPAHNFQTDQAGVSGRTACGCADNCGPDSRRAAELKREFLRGKIVKRAQLLQARASVALQEHPMKTHLIICNEADYLQAHLTIIVGKPRSGSQVLHDFKRRVTSRWKKMIRA